MAQPGIHALAEPACDLGIAMREWSDGLLAGDPLELGRRRCARLHRLTGVDPAAMWQWGFVERVSSGLLFLELGDRREAHQHLAIAGAWLDG